MCIVPVNKKFSFLTCVTVCRQFKMTEPNDYKSVVKAVMKFGVDKRDLIGNELEMTDAE